MSDNRDPEAAASGTDAGTGDPGTDRAFLQDMPPAQVNDDEVEAHSVESASDDDVSDDGVSDAEAAQA
jgi:hypothetical protein